MDTSYTQQHQEVDTKSAGISASLSTSTMPQQSSLFQDERSSTDSKKRAYFAESDDEALNDEASDDEDAPSVGGILLYDPSISKRQRTEKATNITCISKAVDFTIPQENDAVNLKIGDDSLVTVSKAVMRYVPYLNTLFSKEWEQPAYSLSEDDPFALKVLLAILHHRVDLLPSDITFSQLYELALVCDKYGTQDVVSHYVESREWIGALWKDGKPCPEVGLRSWTSWLWICHVFQTKKGKGSERHERVLDVLAANMRQRVDDWYIDGRNSLIKVSTIECPSALDPLEETLCKRRKSLWYACLKDCRKRQNIAIDRSRFDFKVIGVQAVLVRRLERGLSLTETLAGRLGTPPACPQSDVHTFLGPWIQKFSL